MADLLLYDHPGSICSQMARLALAEMGLSYRRQTIDIMEAAEQFEPWYVALNPRAVVPTLAIDDEIVTDTIHIVNRANDLGGTNLICGDAQSVQNWMRQVMDLHYGVLLYAGRLEKDGTSPTMIARGRILRDLRDQRPDLKELLDRRIEGNSRLQLILKDPQKVSEHIDTARTLTRAMDSALATSEFLAGGHYSLADCFATAALARFRVHGFEGWWSGEENPNVAAYYNAMKSRPSFSEAQVIDTGTERDL